MRFDIDLQLFSDGEPPSQQAATTPGAPVPAPPAAAPAQAPEAAPPQPAVQAAPVTPAAPAAAKEGTATSLLAFLQGRQAEANQQPPATSAPQTPPAAPSAQPAPVAATAAQPEAPAIQPAPSVPPVQAPSLVPMPQEMVQLMARLALQAQPVPVAPQIPAIPAPELPPLPELPDILKPEKRDQAYFDNPQAVIDATIEHRMATERIKAERARLTKEHEAKVQQQKQLSEFTGAYTEQVLALGQATFNERADVASQVIKEIPDLLKLPPKTAVALAFKIAEKISVPPPAPNLDVTKLQADQINVLKAHFGPQIIQEYLQKVGSGQQVPQVITGALPAGQPPITPPNRPRTIDEAKAQWKRSMGV